MARPSRSKSQVLASTLLSSKAAWMIEIQRADFVNMLPEKGRKGVDEQKCVCQRREVKTEVFGVGYPPRSLLRRRIGLPEKSWEGHLVKG
jgi:hypothetical protein